MQAQDTIPAGFCWCGCGQPTKVAKRAYSGPIRYRKGEHFRYVYGHGRRLSPDEYIVDQKTGCWMWSRGIDGGGYGQAWRDGRSVKAHIMIYERHGGVVPDDLDIDHLCHTRDLSCPGGTTCLHRRCVNPDHLELVTPRENVLRGRTFTARNASKTHCLRGHPFSDENTWYSPKNDGRRYCRECLRLRRREDRAAMREANPPSPRQGKTHCKRGHAFDERNTIAYTHLGKRKRACRACRLIQKQIREAKQQAN